MRVIAGKARSLPLSTIPGEATRPTTDRIKETLFNMLQPYLCEARFLDLFAGSGAIGIEALSRGAKEAVFVDQSEEAVKVIRENLAFTRFTEESTVLRSDAVSAIERMKAGSGSPFDLIFMDPPYRKELEKKVLSALSGSNLLTDETIVIFEASADSDLAFPEKMGYRILKIKKYGTNCHVWLQQE